MLFMDIKQQRESVMSSYLYTNLRVYNVAIEQEYALI